MRFGLGIVFTLCMGALPVHAQGLLLFEDCTRQASFPNWSVFVEAVDGSDGPVLISHLKHKEDFLGFTIEKKVGMGSSELRMAPPAKFFVQAGRGASREKLLFAIEGENRWEALVDFHHTSAEVFGEFFDPYTAQPLTRREFIQLLVFLVEEKTVDLEIFNIEGVEYSYSIDVEGVFNSKRFSFSELNICSPHG